MTNFSNFYHLHQYLRVATFALLLIPSELQAQIDFEVAPIHYPTSVSNDAIFKLDRALERQEKHLTWDTNYGYLKSILEALGVPIESQLLVFSKTSLQNSRISPSRPRALYFNDDVYIGWVQYGDVVELSAVDDKLGAVFYTLPQKKVLKPRFIRDQDDCLSCHASYRTKSVPGYLIRSVYPSENGQPHFGLGTVNVDQTTPFEKKYGGWYITGKHGEMRHRGNALADRDQNPPIDISSDSPYANWHTLKGIVNTKPYLSSDSDLIAMLVLEHQAQMHNLITRAGYVAQHCLHYDAKMNKILERPDGFQSDLSRSRIKDAGEKLLKYLFFSEADQLESKVSGTSGFQTHFEKLGPFDEKGRSLRQFNLKSRLFEYPMSYLIYSSSFNALPPAMMDYLKQRVKTILDGDDDSESYSHLSVKTRRRIKEVLSGTQGHPFK